MSTGFRGTGQVITTSFLIPEDSLDYWIERLKRYGIRFSGPTSRFDGKELVITFSDPDGMELEFIALKNIELRTDHIWKKDPIPEEYATRGIYSATLLSEDYEQTTVVILTENLGFSKTKGEGARIRFEIKDNEKIIDRLFSNKQKRELTVLYSSANVDLLCIPHSQRFH